MIREYRDRARAGRRQDTLQNAILDAAEHVFMWKGYQQTTIETLAQEAGVSVGTLYNLFRNKEGIYAEVAGRIGRFVVSRIRPLISNSDAEQAVLDVIRFRLYNYVNDRLFFQPFCFPGYLGVQPEPARLGAELNQLYQQYVETVEKIFTRCLAGSDRKATPVMKMAPFIEGMVTTFMGYWSQPLQSDNLARVARHMRTVLLHGVGPSLGQMDETETTAAFCSRKIYINRYDLERLRELLVVVRSFGKKDSQEYANTLESELKHALVTNPREVPTDVVTMNSQVRVLNLATGGDRIITLVFPRDANLAQNNVSILNPLGTSILGRRLGDVFALGSGQDAEMYQVARMLYQPEAAGDYHL